MKKGLTTLALSMSAVVLTGCGTSDTMSSGAWGEGPMREDGGALRAAIDALVVTGHGANLAFDPASCQRLADVVTQAQNRPGPDDSELSSAWSAVLRAGSETATACMANDGEAVLDGMSGVTTALGLVSDRVASL